MDSLRNHSRSLLSASLLALEDLTDLHRDITSTSFSGKQVGSTKGGCCPSRKAVKLSPVCPFLCPVHNIPVRSCFWSRSYAFLSLWEITRHWPVKGFNEVRHYVSQESAEEDKASFPRSWAPVSLLWWSLALVCGLSPGDPFSQSRCEDDVEVSIL